MKALRRRKRSHAWCCASKRVRKSLHEVWDLWSIREKPMTEKKSYKHPGNWCNPTKIQKSEILKRVDKRMFRKQQGNWCRRTKNKQNVMRETILTPQSQGILLHHYQNWKTWNTRTIDTWARSFSVCGRSWERPQLTKDSQWKLTKQMYWYGESLWLRRWKPAVHLGPNYVSNSEIYKNTQFEKIWSVLNMTQKLVIEHSEEILIVKCPEYSSPSWARSVFANDQAIMWAKAKVCVYADSVLCVGHSRSNRKMGRSSGGTQVVLVLPRCSGHRWRSNWIRVEKCSHDFHHCLFFKKSNKTWRNGRSSQKSSRTGSSSCQCSKTLIGKNEKMRSVFRMPKKSGITQWNSCKDIGRCRVQGQKRSGMEVFSRYKKKQAIELYSRQNGATIQRSWWSWLQKNQCPESWNLEAKERWNIHSLQLRFMSTEL